MHIDLFKHESVVEHSFNQFVKKCRLISWRNKQTVVESIFESHCIFPETHYWVFLVATVPLCFCLELFPLMEQNMQRGRKTLFFPLPSLPFSHLDDGLMCFPCFRLPWVFVLLQDELFAYTGRFLSHTLASSTWPEDSTHSPFTWWPFVVSSLSFSLHQHTFLFLCFPINFISVIAVIT